jgi:hypothetical protein
MIVRIVDVRDKNDSDGAAVSAKQIECILRYLEAVGLDEDNVQDKNYNYRKTKIARSR